MGCGEGGAVGKEDPLGGDLEEGKGADVGDVGRTG